MKKLLSFLILTALHANATDHIDGHVTIKNGVADLSDLFVFTDKEKKNELVVILNMYPAVASTGHFSKKVKYRVSIAPVDPKSYTEDRKDLDIGKPVTIECNITDPHDDYQLKCQSSNGLKSTATYGKLDSRGDFDSYMGMHSDPQFINFWWFRRIVMDGKYKKPARASNDSARINVLSIALRFSLKALFPNVEGTLFGAVATSIAKDGYDRWGERQIDRLGRGELTNTGIYKRNATELRNQFNTIEPFGVIKKVMHEPTFEPRVRKRVLERLKHYDQIDGTNDFTPEEQERLAQLLLDDYLLIDVDPKKRCRPDDLFEIEKSLLKRKPYESCGGRKLEADFFDILFRYLIAKDRPETYFGDSVDHPYRPPTKSFPYLADPDLSPTAKAWSLLTRIGSPYVLK